MDDLVNTDEMISDADFLPPPLASNKSTGKGAPDLLSNMSGTECIGVTAAHLHVQPQLLYNFACVA